MLHFGVRLMDGVAGRVSVLMPLYNAAPYVADALASVLAQDVPDLEVIVCDDGSTDGSADIVAATPGVRLVRQHNRGAGAARNAAFAASTGAFVIYFDADDLMGERHLPALLATATAHPGAVAMSEWARFRGGPDAAVWPRRHTYRERSGIDWLLFDWEDGLPMTQCGMFLLPRALVNARGGWDERLALNDDFEFFCRLLPHAAGMRFAQGARLCYRTMMPGSLSQTDTMRGYETALEAALTGAAHVLAFEDTPRTRCACANIVRAFDWNYYPAVPHLRAEARRRAAELGGATGVPVGPPHFQTMRKVLGWRLARRIELAMNGAPPRRASTSP